MSKVTVETTGDFMLVDPANGEEIPADGSRTVPYTHFVQERLDIGQLKLADGAELPEGEPEVDPTIVELPEEEEETDNGGTDTADANRAEAENQADEAAEAAADAHTAEVTELSQLDRDGNGAAGGSLPGNQTAPAAKGPRGKRRSK